MAVPAYATDLNDIFLNGSATWTLVGGGRQTAVETDDFIMGTSCWSHDPFSSGLEGGVFNSAETVATDDAVFVWIKCDVVATIDTHANGGQRILIGNTATTLDSFYVLGSDDYQYGGWRCIPVDPTLTPSTTVGGGGNGTTAWFGGQWSVPATGASKGYPMKVDAMRHGRQIEITAGEIANPASWSTTAIYDSDTARQWGICQPTNAGAEIQGLVYWGTGATSVYSRDSNKTIEIIDTEWTVTDFTQVLFANASNDVVWDNISLKALGTSNRGIIDVTADGAVTWTNSVFEGIDITNLLASSTFDGSRWLSCNEVTAGGASLLGCKILTPSVAIDSYGLLWNTTGDPDGELDGMEFSKGATAHHAIEFDATNTPLSITLRNIDFTGFNATNGNNDSALNFPSTSKSYTVNLVGCTGDISYQVGVGGSVTLVQDPVTLQVTVLDSDDGLPIENARVYVPVTSGANFPYQASVTITGTGTTATATHTAHGLATNDYVVISGANEDVYNGVYQITVTGVNTYTYTTNETIASSPATGTIISTFVVISGLTNASGVISDTRTYGVDQPIGGWVRKSTSAPYFKQGTIVDTVGSTTGKSITIQLISDE